MPDHLHVPALPTLTLRIARIAAFAARALLGALLIGMVLVTIDQRHIALDFLVNRLAPRPRIALTMFHHLVIAIGAAYAAVQSLEFARRVAMIGQTSMAIGFPMVFAHSALVVGFAGTALVATVLVVSGCTELVISHHATKAKLP